MTKRKMILHVGPHKTGTTTIQMGLVKSREELAKAGFRYPKTGMLYYGQHNLVSDIAGFSLFDPALGGINELRQYAKTTSDNIIISSENFDLICEAAPLLRFKEAFDPEFDFKVICYLRRQEEVLLSLWKLEHQLVGFKNVLDTPGTSVHDLLFEPWVAHALEHRGFLNYDRWLGILVSVFGRESLCVNIYRPGDKDLFTSFLTLCGVDNTNDFKDAAIENVSRPDILFEIVRLFVIAPRKQAAKESREPKQPKLDGAYYEDATLTKVARHYLKARNIPMDRSYYNKRMLEEIQSHFAKPNSAIANSFFGRKRLFENPCRIVPHENDVLEPLSARQLGEIASHYMTIIAAK